jgi:hypothetical protein
LSGGWERRRRRKRRRNRHELVEGESMRLQIE